MIQAELMPRTVACGALGGEAEIFSEEVLPLRAARIPEDGELAAGKRGAERAERLRLLVAVDIPVHVGDGVRMAGRLYRIMAVRRWTAHLELVCEAIV